MIQAFSYGGGVQSTAALVLAAHGQIDYRTFLFSNVGEDSERPETIAYVRDVAMPFAAEHDLELVELTPTRFKQPQTLLNLLVDPKRMSLGIPMRGSDGGPVVPRSCTRDFKIRVVDRELVRRGATKDEPATIGLGISTDEWQRATNRPGEHHVPAYPLLDLGISRSDCARAIADARLPLPPKSACWFCPYTRMAEWIEMKQRDPDRFAAAVALERTIRDKQIAAGNDPVYLTRYRGPLDEVVPDQMTLDFADDDGCESGFCMT